MRLLASVTIQRPIAAVFDFLSTARYLPCWVEDIVEADGPHADAMGVGAKLVTRTEGALGPVISTWEVTAYEPPSTLAVRLLSADIPALEARWRLDGVMHANTQVEVAADIESTSFFHVEDARLKEVGLERMHMDLDRLRRALELNPGKKGSSEP